MSIHEGNLISRALTYGITQKVFNVPEVQKLILTIIKVIAIKDRAMCARNHRVTMVVHQIS